MPRARIVLPAAVYAVLAVADTVAAGRSGGTSARRLRFILKPALMPALAAAFLGGTRSRAAAGGPAGGGPAGGGEAGADTHLLRTGTAVAQALSWGGDVALLGTSERSFLTGVDPSPGPTSRTSLRSCRCVATAGTTTPQVSGWHSACGWASLP
jgi:hypothetical protein